MKFLVTALTLTLTTVVFGQNIDFAHKNWDKIKAKAVKENKIIFVDAYTTWCGPCKWMSANVFTDKTVADFYNENFVNAKLDMEAGEGLDFAKEYKVVAYPTLLFIDGEGEIVHKRLGAMPADAFVELGREALDPERRIGTLMAEYEAGNRDPEFLQKYVTRMISAGMDPMDAAEIYFSGLSSEQLVTRQNFELIRMLRPSMDSEYFAKVADNRDGFAEAVNAEEVDKFLKDVTTSALLRDIYNEDKTSFDEHKSAIAAMPGEFGKEVTLYGDLRYAWAEGRYDEFVDLTEKYATKYAWDNWSTLNTIAWDIYEDSYASKDYLDLGLKLAKQSVKIEENYYNTDTYAALLYKSGKYKKAIEWADTAIDHAVKEGMDPADTQKLKDKIKEAMM